MKVHNLELRDNATINHLNFKEKTEDFSIEKAQGKIWYCDGKLKIGSNNLIVDLSAGVDGKSAYELAVADGFIGSESEWLNSLKGSDGKDFQIVKIYKTEEELLLGFTIDTEIKIGEFVLLFDDSDENETIGRLYIKTETEFSFISTISGVKGIQGEPGKDGKDGEDGYSAYQLAVSEGFGGDLSEWLLSLKGETGKDGKAFSIKKVYNSVDEMTLDLDNTEITEGDFVLIYSETSIEDNGKVFVRTSEEFVFFIDLSYMDSIIGPEGPQGKDGEIGNRGSSAYEVATIFGFVGTEAEWLSSLKGERGDSGLTPKLRKTETHLQVSYNNGDSWQNLYTSDEIKGSRGPQGEQGKPFSIKKIYSSFDEMNEDFDNPEVAITDIVLINIDSVEEPDNAKLYIKTETHYEFLVDMSGATGVQGPKGTTPLFQKTESHLQVSYDSGETYENLISIEEISGYTPLLRNNNNAIEVSIDGGNEYKRLVELIDLMGREGKQGEKGDPGAGLTIAKMYSSTLAMEADFHNENIKLYDVVVVYTVNEDETYKNDLYIRDDSEWRFLATITTEFVIEGPKGDAGIDGLTPLMRVKSGWIEISYNDGLTYQQLVLLQTLKGPIGEPGPIGKTGEKGDPPLLKKDSGEILVSYDDGKNFSKLVELEEIKGDTGNTGPSPVVDFRFNAGFLEVAADGQIEINDYKQLIAEDKLVGPSAYDIAKAYGFTGTKEEWLLSLIGARGPKGNTGDSLKILGAYLTIEELPPSGESGDAYIIGRDLYVWNPSANEDEGGFVNAGNLKGLDGEFVNIPKHDSYLVDKVGMLRFFMKGLTPTNYVEVDTVRLLKKAEYAELYDVIGDIYADKIIEIVNDNDEPIYTQVPEDSFVLNKSIISERLLDEGYTLAICAYLDSLHYNTVGELTFVYEGSEVLDERIWLRADGSTEYGIGFFPEVANIFARANIEGISKKSHPVMTSNVAPAPYTVEGYRADGVTVSQYDANRAAWKAFNGTQGTSNDEWISANNVALPAYLQINSNNNASNEYLYQYSITSRNNSGVSGPTSWQLQGCTTVAGTNWEVLHSQTGQTWTQNQTRTYTLDQKVWDPNRTTSKCYAKYRLCITGSMTAAYVSIGELQLKTFTKEEYDSLPKFVLPNLSDLAPEGTIPYFRVRGDLKLNYEGPEGKDAFETMVSRGFTGTYDEWKEAIRGPMGFCSIFNVVNSYAELPQPGEFGVGYIIGNNLWVWKDPSYTDLGRWRGLSLYESAVEEGYNESKEEFDKIIRNLSVADVKAWTIDGINDTSRYLLAGANSNNAASYIVIKKVEDETSILTPDIEYTIDGSYIIFTDALTEEDKVSVREFNHAVNLDKYADETGVGEVIYSFRDKGSNYIKLDPTVKLIKKIQYPELYALFGDTFTADCVTRPFEDMTSNSAPSPYIASADNEYNTTYQAWKAFTSNNSSNTWTWYSTNTVHPHELRFSTGQQPIHRLYRYEVTNRPATNEAPMTWEMYIGVDPSLTVDDWIKVDTVTENEWPSVAGTYTKEYEVPNADAYPPFGKIKFRILNNRTGTNYGTCGFLNLRTINTAKYEEGSSFKLSEYFGIPGGVANEIGASPYLKAKPLNTIPVNYMNEYELWISQGHTGTYEEFLMSRTIEPEIAKAFHGNLSTLIKRFDFVNEPLSKVDGYKILVPSKRAHYQLRVTGKTKNISTTDHIVALRPNGDTSNNYKTRQIYASSDTAIANAVRNDSYIWAGVFNTTNTAQTISITDIYVTDNGGLTYKTWYNNQTGAVADQYYHIDGYCTTPYSSGIKFIQLDILSQVETDLFDGSIEIYEDKSFTPVELHSKEIIFENSLIQQNFSQDLNVDSSTTVEMIIDSSKPITLKLDHTPAVVNGTGYQQLQTANITELLQVRYAVDTVNKIVLEFTEKKVVAHVESSVSGSDGVIVTKNEYLISPNNGTFGKTYNLSIDNFSGYIKVFRDVTSHAIAANPDSISGLTITSTEDGIISIEPGSLELNGSLNYNYRKTSVDIIENIGTREVLDYNEPLYVYGYNDDLSTKELSFRVSHSEPTEDRFGNEFTGNFNILGLFITNSDKLYRLLGIVQFTDSSLTEIEVLLPTLKHDYDINVTLNNIEEATKTQAGKIKLVSNTLDFSNDTDAVTMKDVKEILTQNTVEDYDFVGDGITNAFPLESNYQSKDYLVIVGGAFISPNKYSITEKILSFTDIVPADVEISIRSLKSSVNAYSDNKNTQIASRLSMYILHNNEAL